MGETIYAHKSKKDAPASGLVTGAMGKAETGEGGAELALPYDTTSDAILSTILDALPGLDAEALDAVHRAVHALILEACSLGNDSDESSDDCSLNDEPDHGCVTLPAGVPRGAHIEEKMINGCGPYLYARWRESGRLRSRYLGKKVTP